MWKKFTHPARVGGLLTMLAGASIFVHDYPELAGLVAIVGAWLTGEVGAKSQPVKSKDHTYD